MSDIKLYISWNYKNCRLVLTIVLFKKRFFPLIPSSSAVRETLRWIKGDSGWISWVALHEMRNRLWDLLLEELLSESWSSWFFSQMHSYTQILCSTACLRVCCVMPQQLACLFFQSTVHMSEVRTICDYICIYGLVWLWKMIALRFNKQKSVFALMKGCCHLFCRSATIRAPCGFCDRLFFCITLNKRVQCINLTLLGETKKGPLIQ